jgi:hypothetical protein
MPTTTGYVINPADLMTGPSNIVSQNVSQEMFPFMSWGYATSIPTQNQGEVIIDQRAPAGNYHVEVDSFDWFRVAALLAGGAIVYVLMRSSR